MNKIKTAIIHWLGGVTQEESQFMHSKGWHDGFRSAHNATIGLMKSCNGLPADEWCKRVWNGINNNFKQPDIE